MKRITSLDDLLVEELADLFNVETQLAEALPQMARASHSSALKVVFEDYVEITKDHIYRLRDIFSNIGQNLQEAPSQTMKNFLATSQEVVSQVEKSSARDIAIINVVKRVEQYEISKYLAAREHAADLGHTRLVELLTETLNEERAMTFHLNELAQGMINAQAIDPKGVYQGEGRYKKGGISRKIRNKGNSRFATDKADNNFKV